MPDNKLTDMSICRDCFHSYVCEQYNENRECDNKKCHFANDHFVPDDLINRLQAENENLLKELDESAYKLGCLLCHATGGKLSKHTYPLRVMESYVNDTIQDYCEEAEAEAKTKAYKEFAEKIKDNTREFGSANGVQREVDNLLKELIGKNDIGRYDPYTDSFIKELVGE